MKDHKSAYESQNFIPKLQEPLSDRDYINLVNGRGTPELERLLKESRVAEGLVWPHVMATTFKERRDVLRTMLVHRDKDRRLNIRPKEGREDGLWVFTPESYPAAQKAGIEELLRADSLTGEQKAKLEAILDTLDSPEPENIPLGYWFVNSPQFTFELVRAYQAAVLSAPSVTKQRIDWRLGNPHSVERKIIVMEKGVPHMREVLSKENFEEGKSVNYMDTQSDPYS